MNSATTPPEPALPSRSRAQMTVVIAAVLLAAGPLVYAFGRREVARWHFAAGFERLLQDDLDGALEQIDHAIAWHPRDANLMMQRASWKMRSGDVDTALADCDLALKLARAEFASSPTPRSQQRLAFALNQRAYAYALAEANLEEALENVEQALGMTGNSYNMLDTRGYIHLKLGNLPAAQRDLEQALRSAEDSYKTSLSALRRAREEMVDTRPLLELEQQLKEGLAVLTHHRGELYEALDREDDAIRDLRRAKVLGYDPQQGVW